MAKFYIDALNESDLRRVFQEELKKVGYSGKKETNSSRKINYLTRFEVAKLLKISLPTLGNWTKEGILQSYRIGNRVLYKEDEIISAVKETKNLNNKLIKG